MSKKPLQKLSQLKVLVNEDQEGKEAREEVDLEALRPRTRRDCLPGGRNEMRPCPWYACKYHLGLDINEDTGSISVRNLDDMVHTCDLDVAEIGGVPGEGRGIGITFEEAGEIMDLTKERMRQVEFDGILKTRAQLIARGMEPDDWRRWIAAKQRQADVKSKPVDEIQEDQEKPLDSDGERD